MAYDLFDPDWVGVEDPWVGTNIDLDALQSIVCQVLNESVTQSGPPVRLNHKEEGEAQGYARIYSFQLPSRSVIARVIAPVKPLFKTEAEIAAMDFVRSQTTLPVPVVFSYCSEATNPVGAEWIIMDRVPGVPMYSAWEDLTLSQRQTLALDIIDIFDQLYKLKADACGSIYHNVDSVDDGDVICAKRFTSNIPGVGQYRSARWQPLSVESLRRLRSLCIRSYKDGYKLGPSNDNDLLNYNLTVPSPSLTMPTFTSTDYFKLIAYNGNPTTRSDYDFPTREKAAELFQSVHNLYPNSRLFGPSGDTCNFRFSHGDLHDENILIDPQTGSITGIIDWEAAAFAPIWAHMCGVGWFTEDTQRFISGGFGDPTNFEDDTGPHDVALRAFFRTQLYQKNPDLFNCFLGGIELRAILGCAGDEPRPSGGAEMFLDRYYELGCWNEARRGPFPLDMLAWSKRRCNLDIIHMNRIKDLKKAHGLC